MRKNLVSILIAGFVLLGASCTPPCVDWCVKKPKVIKVITIEDVNFDFDKDTLKASAKEILDKEAPSILEQKNWKLKVEGHTDNFGTDEYNDRLSSRRAKSVYDYLLSKGVSSDRMRREYYGEKNPKVPNDNPNNRAINRRVEIKVME